MPQEIMDGIKKGKSLAEIFLDKTPDQKRIMIEKSGAFSYFVEYGDLDKLRELLIEAKSLNIKLIRTENGEPRGHGYSAIVSSLHSSHQRIPIELPNISECIRIIFDSLTDEEKTEIFKSRKFHDELEYAIKKGYVNSIKIFLDEVLKFPQLAVKMLTYSKDQHKHYVFRHKSKNSRQVMELLLEAAESCKIKDKMKSSGDLYELFIY